MATKTKLPVFQGKPLVEIPAVIPSADFLGGDFGKPVLEEYNGRVKSDYNNASALNFLILILLLPSLFSLLETHPYELSYYNYL